MKKIGKTSKNRIKYLHFCKETCNINSRLFVKIERRDYMNIQYELNILADERYKDSKENCLKKQDTLWEKSTVR